MGKDEHTIKVFQPMCFACDHSKRTGKTIRVRGTTREIRECTLFGIPVGESSAICTAATNKPKPKQLKPRPTGWEDF